MSDVSYVRCDGCGVIDTDGREDYWRREVSGWAEVRVRDDDDGKVITMDFCTECWKKLIKAVNE